MSATADLISVLVAGGMNAAEAAGMVARAAVEMTGIINRKSPAAIRQQRYRERNKASPNVTLTDSVAPQNHNETSQSVTPLCSDEASQTITNRNKSITSDTTSLSKEEKKEVIKKEKRESRASQLPDNWRPDAKFWDEAVLILGSEDRAGHELRKFKLHALDKGRLAKNWNAAWVKWALQAIEYGNRNGQSISNHRADPAAGRATAREARHVSTMGNAALRYLEEGKPAGQIGEAQGRSGLAEGFDLRGGSKNAH